jgi:cadmium resistance protein CadD (predicted permease)
MSDLDGLKEEIAYLKLWLGIMVVTGISLIGWLLGNFRSAHWMLVFGGFLGLVSIGFGCFALHQRIEAKIADVKRL